MPKLEFTEAYWNQATSVFEGVQVGPQDEQGERQDPFLLLGFSKNR